MALDERLFRRRVMLRVKPDAADLLGVVKKIAGEVDGAISAERLMSSGQFERALEIFIDRVHEAEAAVLAAT